MSSNIKRAISARQVASATTSRIASLFSSFGSNEYIGEAVTLATHGLQTAFAAKQAGENSDVQLAGLLHDIGHLLALEAGKEMEMEDDNGEATGTMDHDILGGEFLEKLGFKESISFVARRHVDAKRYLCARDAGYYDALSPASKTTLMYQDGPMSEEECLDFERSPSYAFAAKVRRYDDDAKKQGLQIPGLDTYLPLIEKHIEKNVKMLIESKDLSVLSPFADSYVISRPQLSEWDRNGMLHIANAIGDKNAGVALHAWATEVALWANEDTSFMDASENEIINKYPFLKHFEAIDGDEKNLQLARVENFSRLHDGWGNLTFGLVNDLVSQVYRENAVLFKDKLNFKMPGGAGFLCHQDATAYATGKLAKHHVSAMVAIDGATVENGCLQVAPGLHNDGVLKNSNGVTCETLESKMEFLDIITQPGDIVLFDSFLPHKSGPNKTVESRRLAYLTYNKEQEGDFHAQYYATKIENMGPGRMSLNNDFAGVLL